MCFDLRSAVKIVMEEERCRCVKGVFMLSMVLGSFGERGKKSKKHSGPAERFLVVRKRNHELVDVAIWEKRENGKHVRFPRRLRILRERDHDLRPR